MSKLPGTTYNNKNDVIKTDCKNNKEKYLNMRW